MTLNDRPVVAVETNITISITTAGDDMLGHRSGLIHVSCHRVCWISQ